MAPRKNARKPIKKKKKNHPVVVEKKQEMMMMMITNNNNNNNNLSSSPVKLFSDDSMKKKNKNMENNNDDHENSISIGCTTPKAQKYKIPKILTCPPAPKKRRPTSVSSSCTLSRRTQQISFFDPPDLELFFASHLASIYNRVHTHVR